MIFFGFDFCIPYKIRKDQEDLWYKDYSLSKNKSIEFQIYRSGFGFVVIDLEFSFHPYQSHGGIRIGLGLFGQTLIINFYDKRHWDYKKGTWEVYDES